jgi:L-alanine-DL-glutamate epimerase-like enolase superfamily enzyme
VKLSGIALEPVRWDLRGALRTARGPLVERVGIRVHAIDTDGCRGTGEALPLPASGTEDLAAARRALERAGHRLAGAPGELDELLDAVDALCAGAPAARCGLDVALHDLAGRRAGIPVAHLLGPAPLHGLAVNALVDALDPLSIASARRSGFATLKLKLGREPLERELAALGALLRGPARGVRVRLDPNGAWTRDQAHRALEQLARSGVELVEQPVAAGDLDGLRALARGPVPIAADEALALPSGRASLVAGELTPLAVLKPMVQGGLRAAARLARAAASAGVRCIVTTTLDGPAATAAAAQLAAAVCDGSLACGVAAQRVAADFPDWLVPRCGRIELPQRPGLGLGEQP